MQEYELIKGFDITPYFRKQLKSYYNNYSNDNLTVLTDTAVKEVVENQGFFIKEAPRSVYKVKKLYDSLSPYSPDRAPYIDKKSVYLAKGVALARVCFAKPAHEEFLDVMTLCPSTIKTITSNPNGSAGLTAPSSSKSAAHTRALERSIQILKGEKSPEPCMAFKRTQANDKTRLVWGYPYSMTVIEGLVAYPLNQKFKNRVSPMAFAMTTMALGTRLRVSSYSSRFCYSLDMSKFDSSISSILINHAFKILRTWFNPHQVEPTTGKAVHEIFDIIQSYFVTTPIMMPNAHVYKGKKHGVPSGSYFTQIIDSIVNVILAGTIDAKFNLGISRRKILVLGDDLLFFSDRKISLDRISKFAKQHLGINVHGSEKSSIFNKGDVIHFLGRDWHNGQPDIPIDDIVAKMVHPESFRKYSRIKEEKKRQVHLLLMSYASTYKSGWRIAEREINPQYRNLRRGEIPIDTFVYIHSRKDQLWEIDPSMLTGLQRYQRKYHGDGERKEPPRSGGQYLL